ncbi:MAG: hypothetical protein Q7U10_05715 [Thermodesulfovibrionia bacterium]|nr:hypothetical protein [Thermodesulfovibrionia bacterium]
MMYTEHTVRCRCGKRAVSFHFKDNIMPPKIIKILYCPDCASGIAFDPISMLAYNGWIIYYNMDVASFYRSKLPSNDMDNLLPEMLFEKGYATWNRPLTGKDKDIDKIKERCECGALVQNIK